MRVLLALNHPDEEHRAALLPDQACHVRLDHRRDHSQEPAATPGVAPAILRLYRLRRRRVPLGRREVLRASEQARDIARGSQVCQPIYAMQPGPLAPSSFLCWRLRRWRRFLSTPGPSVIWKAGRGSFSCRSRIMWRGSLQPEAAPRWLLLFEQLTEDEKLLAVGYCENRRRASLRDKAHAIFLCLRVAGARRSGHILYDRKRR